MSDLNSQLEQYAYDLHQEVKLKAADETHPQLMEDAFTELVLEILHDHNEVDGTEVCHSALESRGRTPAGKINAWAMSGDGATLDLFISRYHGTGKVEQVSRSDVEQHYKLARNFLKRALDGIYKQLEESSNAFIAARRIFEAADTLTTVRLFLLSDGTVKPIDRLEIEPIKGLEIQPVLWDLTRLSRTKVGHRETVVLDFVNDYDGPISCLQMADCTGEYRTFLAFLSAPLLGRIYGTYGQRLLERNVRSFLQAKGKINKGLQDTLKNEPHRFLAYNNGLCCTAADVTIRPVSNGLVMLERVSDFQIVNGGQTTASIFHAVKKMKTDVSHAVVQVKLTVLKDQSKISELVPLISKYANSQNKVNNADLSANGRYHYELEKLSRTIWAPARTSTGQGTRWYYERARGSYQDDKSKQTTPAKQREWAANHPLDQKFTKTDVAKYECAWAGQPHLTCLGAQNCFTAFAETMENYGEPEVNQDYFKHLVAKAILFRTTEKLFTKAELKAYRANTVAYAIAWIAHHSHHRVDLNWIWEKQAVPPLTEALLTEACKVLHYIIEHSTGNQNEKTKSVTFWNDHKNTPIAIPDGWETEWAPEPFITRYPKQDQLSDQWDSVRTHFQHDYRHITDLETLADRKWMAKFKNTPIRELARLEFSQLKSERGRQYKNLDILISIMKTVIELDRIAAEEAQDETRVIPGRNVRIVHKSNGDSRTICIVDHLPNHEESNGIEYSTLASPLGQALLNRRLGETIEVHTPQGKSDYLIKEMV